MRTSSPTTESDGQPCPICKNVALLEACYPDGASLCAACNHLTRLVRRQLHREYGFPIKQIKLESLLIEDLSLDSMEDIEAIMEIEEMTGVFIPDEMAGRIRSVGDIIATVRQLQRESKST